MKQSPDCLLGPCPVSTALAIHNWAENRWSAWSCREVVHGSTPSNESSGDRTLANCLASSLRPFPLNSCRFCSEAVAKCQSFHPRVMSPERVSPDASS